MEAYRETYSNATVERWQTTDFTPLMQMDH